MPRLANARGVKKHWTYDVAEAARVTAMSRNTVREWIRRGLPTIDGRKPYLIRGVDLKAFLDARNAGRKRSLQAGEIYCVGCHWPRRPANGEAQYRPRTATNGTLVGMCPACGRTISRHVSWTALDDVATA
jgi:hypothetical protein